MTLLSEYRKYSGLLEYEKYRQEAAEGLVNFAEFTMPKPAFADDPGRSTYLAAKHHHLMASYMERVERGEIRKLILRAPPRHGKTELATKRMAAWFWGRNPDKELIIATYGEKFAKDFRTAVRDIMLSIRYRQVFPENVLMHQLVDQITNGYEKSAYFLGRRSPTTGRGGDLLLVDDPVKDDKEAKSQVFRDDAWEWFTQTLLTRRHTDKASWVLTGTQWHEDDLIGRLTDKTNPSYSHKLSEGLVVVSMPALAEDDDVLGRKVGEPLWPERFGTDMLHEMRDANPVSFSALYQGDPSPAEGAFYKAEDIHTYDRGELPEDLRIYGVSDHAVGTAQTNDRTCLMMFGISASGFCYVLPEICWRRIKSDEAVDTMLEFIEKYDPLHWSAEKGQISKAIGPFLRKSMQERQVYCPIHEVTPTADKMARAQSARARAAQGRILFPKYAGWWPQARNELLKFPNSKHDDFVDALSLCGLTLSAQFLATKRTHKRKATAGTWGALKQEFKRQDEERRTRRRY